jgi:hypothetical protein
LPPRRIALHAGRIRRARPVRPATRDDPRPIRAATRASRDREGAVVFAHAWCHTPGATHARRCCSRVSMRGASMPFRKTRVRAWRRVSYSQGHATGLCQPRNVRGEPKLITSARPPFVGKPNVPISLSPFPPFSRGKSLSKHDSPIESWASSAMVASQPGEFASVLCFSSRLLRLLMLQECHCDLF